MSDLQQKLDQEVQEYRQVIQQIEELIAKREQIRGRVQLLEQLIDEENQTNGAVSEEEAVEIVSGDVIEVK